jgi:predicted small lipoprotein YifL
MKRVVMLVAALVLASAAACGLNPQPFPPDNPDAALGAGDASKNNGDSSAFGDAGSVEDSSPLPEGDDASDASDSSDALVDAPNDVSTDVSVDAIDDVTND